MKAIGYHVNLPATNERALVELELPRPQPGPHDLLVAVHAVSVNPVDVKLRSASPATAGAPRILGFDAAGTVEAVGSEARRFSPGDAVFYAGAMDRPGSNSEFQLVDERLVGRKPASLSFEQAAALPLTAITAWELLFDRLGIVRDASATGTLLVINGAGGVGSILIQIARKLTRLTVIATASRPQTVAWCKEMGAHHVVDHHRPLDEAVRDLGLGSIGYVAGLTATERHLPAIVELIAPQGKLAVIDDPKVLDIMPLKRKSVSVHWELMFTRSLYQTADMAEQHAILNAISSLVDAGVLRSTLNEVAGRITAANLRRVHAQVEAGSRIGKTVLSGF